jgi:uncharacterized membrane protein
MRIDEKIQAALFVLLAVYGVLVASPLVLGDRVVEPFSELGVLGPGLKLGGYPEDVGLSEEFELYLYLGNHMGELSYYRVFTKLGDIDLNVSDFEPYDGQVLAIYDYVLVNEANVTFPIFLSLDELGFDQRLVFELQRFDEGDFVYDGLWVQLWLNVTDTG